MVANSARIPTYVDSNAMAKAINALRKGDVVKLALEASGVERVVIIRKGELLISPALDSALLWFTSASEMLDCMCTLGCAVSQSHKQPIDWL